MTGTAYAAARTSTRGGGDGVLVVHPGAELYGSDRMLLESVRGLVEAGMRVCVSVPGEGPLVELLREAGANVSICRTPVLRREVLSARGFVRLLASTVGGVRDGWNLLSRVRPTRVYVSTVAVPLWIMLARLRRIPVLCHVHEAEAAASAPVRAALALPLLLADRVVTNSRFCASVLGRSFPSLGRRATVVHNGVEGPERRMPARRRLDGDLRVAYVGRLSPRKGVDVAVDAAALLRQRNLPVRLDITGAAFAGCEWYERELHERVARQELTGAVRFHGFEPRVWEVLLAADVVVVPSRGDESFGNIAVEALLCGRPVVVAAVSGLVEATAGYLAARAVPPDDPVALADALEQVAADWQHMRTAAWHDIALAEKRHSPQSYRRQVADAVLTLGSGVVSGSLGPARVAAGGGG